MPDRFHPSTSSSSSTIPLPKGVVLDKDGKPCRSCSDYSGWKAMTKKTNSKSSSSTATAAAAAAAVASTAALASSSSSEPTDCPADVEALGRSTWTLLHTLTASYPENASPAQQSEMQTFMGIFSRVYPCWVCAEDFQAWMKRPENRVEDNLGGRKEFGGWMCRAHNEVNKKLGKKEFDCALWEERWKDGWRDGRCG